MSSRDLHRTTTVIMSGAMIAIGVAVIVLTVINAHRGVALGFILGPLFVAAGGLRLYGLRKR
jgi:hypothetical protein